MNIFPTSHRRRGRFEQLVEPHFYRLYRLAYRLTSNQHDAEDLVQELLTRLYPKTAQLQQVDELKTWLARALYNLFIDKLRARGSMVVGHTDDDLSQRLEELPGETVGPEQCQERWQALDQLNQALNQLREPHRTLLIMHDVEGYTLTELQQILDLPLGTLKSRLHRARGGLRQILAMEPFAGNGRVSY
ncbi:MAG: sigma-70 family RNA polymerase sigma factor [Candidatus Thiodiazotropha sp.]